MQKLSEVQKRTIPKTFVWFIPLFRLNEMLCSMLARERGGLPSSGTRGRAGVRGQAAAALSRCQTRCSMKSRLGGRREAGTDAEEGVEGGGGVASSVPAEHELVEGAGQMGPAQPVEDAEAPAFEVGEDPVGPAQHDGRP